MTEAERFVCAHAVVHVTPVLVALAALTRYLLMPQGDDPWGDAVRELQERQEDEAAAKATEPTEEQVRQAREWSEQCGYDLTRLHVMSRSILKTLATYRAESERGLRERVEQLERWLNDAATECGNCDLDGVAGSVRKLKQRAESAEADRDAAQKITSDYLLERIHRKFSRIVDGQCQCPICRKDIDELTEAFAEAEMAQDYAEQRLTTARAEASSLRSERDKWNNQWTQAMLDIGVLKEQLEQARAEAIREERGRCTEIARMFLKPMPNGETIAQAIEADAPGGEVVPAGLVLSHGISAAMWEENWKLAMEESKHWAEMCGEEVKKTDEIRTIVEPFTQQRAKVVDMVRDAVQAIRSETIREILEWLQSEPWNYNKQYVKAKLESMLPRQAIEAGESGQEKK